MIFYFSGTGNSLFIAKKILKPDETLIDIAEVIKKEKFNYTVLENEPVGFVFPVYFYTLPTIVNDFISRINLTNASYVYGIITCGGGIGQAGNCLKKCLSKRNIELDYVKEVLMPDNSMLFYQIPKVSQSRERLDAASEKCSMIVCDIEKRMKTKIGHNTGISDGMKYIYKLCTKTKKFYAEDSCITCGLCKKNCPESAIEIVNKKPIWIKERCCKCSSCINCCPVQAIQYGKSTKRRNRYKNPMV